MEDGDVSPRTLGPSRGAPWDGGSASGGVAVFGDATIASHLQNRILAVPRGTRQNQLHRHRSKELGAKEGSSHFLGGPPSPSSAGAATVWEKRKLVHEEVGQENVVVIGNMSDDLDLAMDGMESAAARGSMLAASTGGGAAMDDDFAEATFLDYPAFGSAAGEDMEMGDV